MVKDKQVNLGTYSLFSTLKSIGLVVAFIIMLFMYLGERDARIEQETLIEASAAELITWKNKDGENMAKIQVMETSSKKDFLKFQSQDSTIIELQNLVKANKKLFKNSKGTAGIIKTETNIDVLAATEVTLDEEKDPIYSSTTKTKWFEVESVATKDSTTIAMKSFHNISIVMGSEGQGLFKKRKTFAIAKDENPYSNIKDMRIYNVTSKKKNFVVGPFVGIGVGSSKGIVRTGLLIGFGVTYKLFEF
jgi:hypothetical protein